MVILVFLACLIVACIFILYEIGKKSPRDYSLFDDKPGESESHSAIRYQDAE